MPSIWRTWRQLDSLDVVTTHCGCTETPIPSTIPMTTYTTTWPTSWGFTAPVAVTVPAVTGILPVATSPASQSSSPGGESAGSGSQSEGQKTALTGGSGPIPAPAATPSTPLAEIGGVPGGAQPTAPVVPASNNPVSTASQSSGIGSMQSASGRATASATNAVFTGVASKLHSHTSVAGLSACLGAFVLFLQFS